MSELKSFIDGLLASGARTFPREALEKIDALAGASTSWINYDPSTLHSLTATGMNPTAAANPFRVNMYPSTYAAAACNPPVIISRFVYLGGGE